MPALATALRNQLEKTVIEARDVAEEGARIALESLAVHHYEPYPHMGEGQRRLRNRLRARGRQLGDVQEAARLELRHLIREVAYEHWHRMLFARFLAENNLLIEPELGIAITMEECEELAHEAGEDPRAMAARFAQVSLPQIFREGDPVLELALPPETQQALDRLLNSLPAEVFTANDSLGWTYQFWQSKRKDEVNASGNKIGADELPAVTQLFTEHYMVQFLYHNTIGAWHAGKVLAANAKLAETAQSEQELRDVVRLESQGGYEFEYLRFIREPKEDDEEDNPTGPWRPAAGTFGGWPETAKEITVLDPCCGSGHFLNEGFQLMVRLRMDEEGLAREDAIHAVLSENLHGLEIDPRCTQIAAFNVALAAWKLAGKPIGLPPLQIACSGLAVGATKRKWVSLAGDDPRLRAGMERLHDLFEQAPMLGSLIDPKALSGDLITADFSELQPLLERALQDESRDDERHERAVAAHGMARAAELLSGQYALSITNVPYLGRGKQIGGLKDYVAKRFPQGKADLATAFLMRCAELCVSGGSTATVTPQNWYFLPSYTSVREELLRNSRFNSVIRLGANAFQDMNFWAATTGLSVLSRSLPSAGWLVFGVDASASKDRSFKMDTLKNGTGAVTRMFEQASQLRNPDARISMGAPSEHPRLGELAMTPQGLKTGDDSRLRRMWWELEQVTGCWRFLHGAPDVSRLIDGATSVVDFREGESAFSRPQGQAAWGSQGVVVKLMGGVTVARYLGEVFDSNVTAIVPRREDLLPALWAFVTHPSFEASLRAIEQSVKINNATVGKVPFDTALWRRSAAEKYPQGLPEPESDDPTQWLFHGHPGGTHPDAVLQVAVARLLGYRWPPELDSEMRLADQAREWVSHCDDLLPYADEDGIVCIPSIRGESPAAERLHALLAAAFGGDWTAEKAGQLIEATDSKAKDLDAWLRNDFFEQHCRLFHHRPFVWHIWDGRKRDGFHALVNYRKLAEGNGGGRRTLELLTFSYLTDWIARQEDGVKRGTAGAEDRLAAALELRKRLADILEGEPPHDLFVRWKSLAEQPIGWDPDINDGVRLNARPFMASDIPGGKKGAGVFRWKPNIKWGKDRGKEPQSLRPKDDYPWFWSWGQQAQDFQGNDDFDGNRWNDLHYTNEARQEARETHDGEVA